MIRTLIVDDEFLIRYGIKNAVNWEELGYQIIGEAENGEDALTQIKLLHPDLVLLDINLPILDGIEVCRRIQEQNLDTQIIILTGYDDFKYIQTCLRLGVLNYVVKPLETDELTAALIKAKQTIFIKKDRHPSLSQFPVGNRPDVYEQIIHILQKNLHTVYVASFEVDYLKRKNSSSNDQSAAIRCAMDGSITFCKDISLNILATRQHNRILIYFLEELNTIQSVCPRIIEYLHLQLGISITIGLCTIQLSCENMPECIDIAQEAIALKFHFGTQSFYQLSSKNKDLSTLEINSSRLYSFLVKNEDEQFLTYIHSILDTASEIHLSKNKYILLCASILNTLLNFSSSLNILLSPVQTAQFSIATYIDYYETAEEIQKELCQICETFVFQYVKKFIMHPLIRKAIAYINQNYADPELSSSNVAQVLAISPNHLSKIFRKELQITITEYITQKRIAEAVNLIERNETISITELAHDVGYNDSFYFSKIFHKQKGLSPSDYIEMENNKRGELLS